MMTVGALIVAAHLGLGGAALAASAWTGWASNTILAIILLKAAFMATHVIVGRFAIRRGYSARFRWVRRRPSSSSSPRTTGGR